MTAPASTRSTSPSTGLQLGQLTAAGVLDDGD